MQQRVFHLHMVSDSTGETVCSVARATLAQFEGVEPEEHVWALIRTRGQIEKVLESIKEKPGFVMYTIAEKGLRNQLRQGCEELGVPCISVLSRPVSDLSSWLGMKTTEHHPGRQHELDDEYFSRVEAINFAITHDDGQSTWDLEEADIILIGVSRTSKSPTCVYLAYRGYRAANVPFVRGVPMPPALETFKDTLVVGLTVSPDRLVQIRKNRLLSLNQHEETDYVTMEMVKEELAEARSYYQRNRWPVIDVTRRSVEETAAYIIQLYQEHKTKKNS